VNVSAKFLSALLVIASATALGHSAAKNRALDSRGVLIAIAQAPKGARSRQNPYEGQPDALLAGAKLFRQHCAECHGEKGWGTDRAANLHSKDVQKATSGELEWFLRNGNLVRGMPSWSGLPEQRLWQIVACLKALR
jgi:mono/diheme cytochrome c family protein